MCFAAFKSYLRDEISSTPVRLPDVFLKAIFGWAEQSRCPTSATSSSASQFHWESTLLQTQKLHPLHFVSLHWTFTVALQNSAFFPPRLSGDFDARKRGSGGAAAPESDAGSIARDRRAVGPWSAASLPPLPSSSVPRCRRPRVGLESHSCVTRRAKRAHSC